MSERRALAGDFADIRTVKSRSVVQVIIELPIEEGENVIKMFGFPQPSNPTKLALARLAEPAQIEAKANGDGREHGPFHDLTPTLQSVLRCKSPAFWQFLRDKGEADVTDETKAATYVRFACGVNTRGALTGMAARRWAELEAEFQAWSAMS